jgi:hypothetical protein
MVPPDQALRVFMGQKRRPSSKANSGSKLPSAPKVEVDDLVRRMSELRRLREQVKRAETGRLQLEESGPTIARETRPK